MIHKYLAFCLTFSLIFLTQNVVFGQIHKGSWLIDGSGNLYASKQAFDFSTARFESQYRNTSLWVSIGYFVTDKMVLGGQLSTSFYYDYSKSFNKTTQESIEQTTNNQSLGFRPYGRYYFTPQKKLKLYGELMLSSSFAHYNAEKLLASVTYPKIDIVQFNASSSFGADYFITPNIALEGSLYYSFYDYQHFKQAPDRSYSKFFYTADVIPQLSMRFFLNTEKKSASVLAEQYLKKGNLTFGLSGVYFGTAKYLSLSPSIGYFVTNRLLLQAYVTMYGDKIANFDRSQLNIVLTPTVKYFHPLSKSTQIVGKVFIRESVTFESNQTPNYSKSASIINGGIGVNKFIADNLSIEGTFNFNYDTPTKKLNFNPNIQFGLAYFMDKKLGKKKS